MIDNSTTLADVLRHLMREKHWSLERLADRSGVSKKTIHNWLKQAGVRKPHTWQPLLLIARTMGLEKGEVSALLQAAQHPPLQGLLDQQLAPQDRALLQPWAASTPHNLPSSTTSLIGRVAELETLRALVAEARLVLLTGAGGSGKTRLALALGQQVLDHFRDGVFVVDLVAIRDPRLVASAIADVLGVSETSNVAVVDSLKHYLELRQMLLLLDNFEQVIEAAPLLTELLSAAPNLRLVVTSRVVLRISGEHEFSVVPLALPDLAQLPPPTELAQVPAVALFLQRVQAVKPGFRLDARTAPAVAEICARLDGLPLAIELAAARVKVLTPEALLKRLSGASSTSALRLLSAGPRDLPARHQTLRATIDWSYTLLSPAEQQLFARLSVFCGCTLDMAEAVCVALGAQPGDALESLSALLDSSLLFQSDGLDGLPRFLLLATIQEFAGERLLESGTAEDVRRAHATVYAAFAAQADQQLCGSEQQHALRRLKAEHDNLRAALRWTIAAGEHTLAMQLGATLWGFWTLHGHLSEGRQWLGQILNMPLLPATAQWAEIVQGAGGLALRQGDYGEAQQRIDQALAYWQTQDQPLKVAELLNMQGYLAGRQGDYDRAARLLQQALEQERTSGTRRGMVRTLLLLVRTAIQQGDPDRAQQQLDEAIALDDEPNDTLGLAGLLRDLGDIAYLRRDYARADDLWQQTLALRQELEDRQGIALTYWSLGRAALELADLTLARQRFSVGLRMSGALADKRGMIDHLIGLSMVAARQGQPLEAARLAGAKEALGEGLGPSPATADQVALEDALSVARREVDQLAWMAAWQAGRAVPLAELIAELCAEHDGSPALSIQL